MTFQNKFSATDPLYYKNHLLTETKEYNFLGTLINAKGQFKRSVEELSKKGMKVIFALRNRFSNFQSLPISLSCKLFDTLIRPILLYNCENWFMEINLPIVKSLERAVRNGNSCDILSLTDKSPYEKVHNKYCKTILGLKKTACNIAAKTELGRLPLDYFIKTQIVLYFCRLNTENINPLLKEAYHINKTLHNDGVYSWYTSTWKIFEECGLQTTDYENLNSPFCKIKSKIKKNFKK